jgi:hypothetical protein
MTMPVATMVAAGIVVLCQDALHRLDSRPPFVLSEVEGHACEVSPVTCASTSLGTNGGADLEMTDDVPNKRGRDDVIWNHSRQCFAALAMMAEAYLILL